MRNGERGVASNAVAVCSHNAEYVSNSADEVVYACTAVSLRVQRMLCTSAAWCAANGHRRVLMLAFAKAARIGRRRMRLDYSAGFICGFHGTMNRRLVLYSASKPSMVVCLKN